MTGTDDAETPGGHAQDPGFAELLDMLSKTYGFDFREYKAPALARRIRVRMGQVHSDGFAAYRQYLLENPDEHIALFNTILINVTGFFRDPEAWKVLAADVIPRIVSSNADSRSIRVWSAGCSSGEEPFSVAMLLAEHLGERASDYHIKIYGTDVDEEALTAARHALFRLDQLKDVPAEMIDRYFTREGQVFRFRRDLRRWCIFGAHNLTQTPPLSHIDLLLCRNVLIYFTSDLQDRILAQFHYALREDGSLFLGRSESLLARSRLFTARHPKWRVFQRLLLGGERHATVSRPDSASPAAAPGYGESAHGETQAAVSRAQRALETLPAAVMVIDMADTVLTWNAAAEQLFDIPSANALTRKFRDLDVSYRVEGLRARIEDVKSRHASTRMENAAFTRRDGAPVHADIAISPLIEGQRLLGILVFAVEATEQARLREQMMRVAEQHATAIEELQSTNEELETTNEELQSTNEELETTNEELQSTNEELETTVEELQAANAELAALNTELEARTAELNRLDSEHNGVINSFDAAIVVLDRSLLVKTWNQAAERLWLLKGEHVLNRDFFSLPTPTIARLSREPFERIYHGASEQELSDLPYTRPGGQTGRASLRLTPLKDGSGSIIGIVAVLSPVDGTPG